MPAAVAHHRATGSDRLLRVACRLADCIDGVFGPGPDRRPGTGGHEEIEMALVELARDTGEPRYLALARFFVDVRGQGHAGVLQGAQDYRRRQAAGRQTPGVQLDPELAP